MLQLSCVLIFQGELLIQTLGFLFRFLPRYLHRPQLHSTAQDRTAKSGGPTPVWLEMHRPLHGCTKRDRFICSTHFIREAKYLLSQARLLLCQDPYLLLQVIDRLLGAPSVCRRGSCLKAAHFTARLGTIVDRIALGTSGRGRRNAQVASGPPARGLLRAQPCSALAIHRSSASDLYPTMRAGCSQPQISHACAGSPAAGGSTSPAHVPASRLCPTRQDGAQRDRAAHRTAKTQRGSGHTFALGAVKHGRP